MHWPGGAGIAEGVKLRLVLQVSVGQTVHWIELLLLEQTVTAGVKKSLGSHCQEQKLTHSFSL